MRFNAQNNLNNLMESLVVDGFSSSFNNYSTVYIKTLKRASFFDEDYATGIYQKQILKLQF